VEVRPLDQRELYPTYALSRRDEIARSGNFRERVAYACFDKPDYAFGLLTAADIAVYFGVQKITAIEFGVGEGAGLLALAELAHSITSTTGVEIKLVGFDRFVGLPEPSSWRDHPEFWAEGDFQVRNPAATQAKLKGVAEIIVGDIAETLTSFGLSSDRPIGFISFDTDTFTSTRDALGLLDAEPTCLLPVVVSCFHDMYGSGTRLSSAMRNSRSGQLGAVAEFNATRPLRVIDPFHVIRHRIVFSREPWLDRIHACHVLDHRLRLRSRQPLSTADWQEQSQLQWQLR
jgi:hypothetical protein